MTPTRLPWRRAACQSVSARIGAEKPEIVAGNGFAKSRIMFATMPFASGSAPVTCVMCETAVSDGVGGTERIA